MLLSNMLNWLADRVASGEERGLRERTRPLREHKAAVDVGLAETEGRTSDDLSKAA